MSRYRVSCPCGGSVTVSAGEAGADVPCPQCSAAIRIPNLSALNHLAAQAQGAGKPKPTQAGATATPPELKTGRAIFIILAVVAVLINVETLHSDIESHEQAVPSLVRLALTIGLLYCVWLGMLWARVLSGFLFLLAVFIAVWGASQLNNLIVWQSFLAVFYFTFFICLTAVPPVRRFLDHQLQSRK
jgi:hypothetical protein